MAVYLRGSLGSYVLQSISLNSMDPSSLRISTIADVMDAGVLRF